MVSYSEACRMIAGMSIKEEKTAALKELNAYLKKYKNKKLFKLRNDLRKTKNLNKIDEILSEIRAQQWIECALNEIGR